MKPLKVIWSLQAKNSLKAIYDYYKEKSPQGAMNVRNDLLHAPKTVHYAKQYQVDDINPKYRRIVVRDFKILYTEKKDEIHVLDIISTRQSPKVLRSK